MSQHLHLYASSHVSLWDAETWCRLSIIDWAENPQEEEAISKIEASMRAIRQHLPDDHLEHWAAGGGVACFWFLSGSAYRCSPDLVCTARQAAKDYQARQITMNPNSQYAIHDWTNDSVIHFLQSHLGQTVWGFNDGI